MASRGAVRETGRTLCPPRQCQHSPQEAGGDGQETERSAFGLLVGTLQGDVLGPAPEVAVGGDADEWADWKVELPGPVGLATKGGGLHHCVVGRDVPTELGR